MSGVTYKIHQELLLGVADHFMLNKTQKAFDTPRVVGGISGKVDGKILHLMKSFAIPWTHTQTIEYYGPIGMAELYKRKLHYFGPNKDLLKPKAEHIGEKSELQSEMYKDLNLVGFYVTGQTESIGELEKLAYETFKQYANGTILIVLFDPTKINKNGQLNLRVYEKNPENENFCEQKFEIATQREEIISLESVMRDLGANVAGGSGYCAVMEKTFMTGLSNYFNNLNNANGLLCDDDNKNNIEMLRKIKEVVINYPHFIFESSKGNLCNKMIMQNIVNLASTVFAKKANARQCGF